MSEKDHRYQLVEFENKMLDPEQNRIECVPTNRVEVDSNVENPVCKFVPSPEKISYEEAMQRLQHLTMDTEESVYTTGCDKSHKEATLTTESFAESARKQQKEMSEIMEVLSRIQNIIRNQNKSYSSEESLEEETTNYSLKFEKETADTLRSSSENQNPEIGSEQKALPLTTELSEEKCESETESSCLSQSIKQSTKSDAIRPTCPEEKERANTSVEEKDVYLSNSSVSNNIKLLMQNMHMTICTLKDKQSIMTKTIEELKEMLHAVLLAVLTNHKALHVEQRAISSLYLFYEKYKLTLPFDTYEKFDEFDRNIRHDRQQNIDFVQTLSTIVTRKIDDNESIVENITVILKKFITKDVAAVINAQKYIHGKCAFKDTYFCICLKSVLCNRVSEERLPFFHDTFLESLDLAFSNI